MKNPELVFFDTNVYIYLLKYPEYSKKIEPILRGGYFYVINKIVLMELWAGVKTPVEENILTQHANEFELIGIKDDQFIIAGQVMSQMQKKYKFEPMVRRRLTWDILIALSAMENKAMLITENTSDFQKIRNWIDFEFMTVP